jgi:beta-glucosidase
VTTGETDQHAGAPFRDPALPVDQRVDDLLGRMTPAEKVAQLGSAWVFQIADGPHLSEERATALLGQGLGQVTRVSGASIATAPQAAALANAIQRHLVRNTRLGIPAILHEEVCSGLMARDATVFPQAIGVASSWDPDLARDLADVVRSHMRAIGAHQGLSPVLDVARDPRWGRTEETFGEDPYLVARMGTAFIRGLQGDDLRTGVAATAKHFVGYAASEGGLNWAPAHIPARELREVHLHPFEAAVVDGGVRSVMHAYHELDGVPCAAHGDLLTGVLRDEWGFDGVVVSDYFAIRQLEAYHRYAADEDEAVRLALAAGIDVELPATDCYGGPLSRGVASGKVPAEALDGAVRRVLHLKFELGLFEEPFVEPPPGPEVLPRPEERSLARHIATRSLVLLRNNGILPLHGAVDGPDGAAIAVIGPNADEARHLFGDYTYPAHMDVFVEALAEGENPFNMPIDEGLAVGGAPPTAPTVLSSLREVYPGEVVFARGCDVNGASRDGFDEAVAAAAAAEVAVLVLGDKSGLPDECTSGESRDRASLELPGVQEDLARAVIATGTPVVLVLVAGRPCGSAWLHENCAAVLMAWMPGQEGAAAIADVLTGVVNPGGKLPITYPRHVGQVPIYYGHKVSGGRSHWKGDYVDQPVAPLHPFGHGLSYTSFGLTDTRAGPAEVAVNGSVAASVTVTNTGDRAGDEVVQLYVYWSRASVTRPVRELKNFTRVPLTAGASATVTFHVPVAQLGHYGRDLTYEVPTGALTVLLGTSSDPADLVEAGTVTVLPAPAGRAPSKVLDGSVEVQHHGAGLARAGRPG